MEQNIEMFYLFKVQNINNENGFVSYKNIPNIDKNECVVKLFEHAVGKLIGAVENLNEMYSVTMNMEQINTYTKQLINAIQFAAIVEQKITEITDNNLDISSLKLDVQPYQEIPSNFHDTLY